MNVTDLEIASLRKAIAEANKMLSSAFGTMIQHTSKDKGIVTEHDLAVEKRIKEILSESLDYPFLAEETAASSQSAQTYWVIDPIDGTTAFAHGNPMFAVSIALVKSGTVVLSAVSNPAYNETFFYDGNITTLNGKQVEMASTKDTPIVFINRGYAAEDGDIAAEVARLLSGKIYSRHLGTTALELAYVAAGRADVLITIGDEIWDYAGGLGLVKGSKGRVADFKGADIGVTSRFIIAGYPKLVEQYIPLLQHLQV